MSVFKKSRSTQNALHLTLLGALLSQMHCALAQESMMHFDIPAMPLNKALLLFGKQSQQQILYGADMTGNLQSKALQGDYSPTQALEHLLSGLPVQAVADAQGTLSLQPKQLSSANASEKTQAMKENTSPLSHEKDDDSVFELGEMIVTTPKENHSLTSKDIATSVDIMYADKIEDQNVLTAYDLYHRMPGVQITQYGQGTTTGKLSFRGFNGEGRVNAVKLLIDGIPSNTNDGNMPFIDAIFPLDIESIETVRGTNDPRYGLHAIAGSSSINTYTGGNYIKGRTSYGSFDTYDVQSGLGYEKNGFSQNYQISYRNSAGYRDHSESDKNSFSGKWFYTPQDHQYKVGLIARWSDADAEEAGYLTSQEKIISRTQSMPRNATDGGKRSVGQVSTHLDINLSETLFWSNKAYGNLFDDQRIVMFDPCCAQVSRNRDEVQYGAITALTYHPKTNWLDDFSIETGFDFQQQENKYKQFRTDLGVPRVPINATNIRNDDRWNFLNYGGYIQAVIKPTKWLKLTPGYRADIIEGDFFSDRPGTNRAFPLNDYGTISQPKIGATITPIEGYSLYGNWGRTFQVGLGQATFIGNANQRNIGPSLNDGWEVGIKAKPTKWLESRVAYWMQDASNEISRTLGSNDSTLIGPSKRQGVDIEVKVNPHRLVDVWSAFSLQEAKVTNPPPSVQYSMEYVAGNQIVNTPNYLFSAGLDYQVTPKLRSSLWTSGQGDFFADQSNTRGKYGEYAMLNLDLGYQITKEVELQFQAKNLNDAKREYLWFDETYGSGAQILYSPSDGRAFYGAVNVRFD